MYIEEYFRVSMLSGVAPQALYPGDVFHESENIVHIFLERYRKKVREKGGSYK